MNISNIRSLFSGESAHPHAWAKINAAFPPSAQSFFFNKTLTPTQEALAQRLLKAVVESAASGNFPGDVSPARMAYLAALSEARALVAKIDGGGGGGGAAGQTEKGLRDRLEKAKQRTDLAPGSLALAKALTIPAEPAEPFAAALDALKLFFA